KKIVKNIEDLLSQELISLEDKQYDEKGNIIFYEIKKGDKIYIESISGDYKDITKSYKNFQEEVTYMKDQLVKRVIIIGKERYPVIGYKRKDYNVPEDSYFIPNLEIFIDGKLQNNLKEGKWKIWTVEGSNAGYANFKNGKLNGELAINADGLYLAREYVDGKLVKTKKQNYNNSIMPKKIKAEWDEFIRNGFPLGN
ncbi:MAG: hypothetical protein KDK36_22235, partial [Leptospiraceae bacterium]|nr:hypothetical protein [Leptospiraceae bacterium]